MKAKILSLMTLSILVLIFTMGLMSADLTLNSVSVNPSVETSKGTFELTFNLTNDATGPDTLTWANSEFNNDKGDAKFSSFSVYSIEALETKTVTAKVSFDEGYVGTISGEINVTNDNDASDSDVLAFSATITGPTEVAECSVTGDGESLMELEIEDIQVVSGFGEDDTEWVPLDTIEVEVRVENTESDWKLEDVAVSWGLYNLDTQEWVFDEEESDFNIKDDDEETLYLTFKLEDPEDFEEGGNYAFYVWAEATGEESDMPVCRAVAKEIDVQIESDFLILSNYEIEGIALEDNMYPDKLSCESTLVLTFDVWNIGDSDQEDIEIRIYNYDFGVDEVLEVGDLDAFDSESLSFEFTIPKGMEEGWNTLELTIQEDGDIFENDYTDDDAEFEVLLDLENCKLAQATISASLESGGKAGRDLVVRATVTNTGDKQTNYIVNAYGYTEWASSANVEPATLLLQAGQSADVLITLDVEGDVEGEKLFNIEVLSEGELVMSQPLSVNIEKSLLGDVFGGNTLLAALVIGIAVILVVIIVVLVVRVARK